MLSASRSCRGCSGPPAARASPGGTRQKPAKLCTFAFFLTILRVMYPKREITRPDVRGSDAKRAVSESGTTCPRAPSRHAPGSFPYAERCGRHTVASRAVGAARADASGRYTQTPLSGNRRPDHSAKRRFHFFGLTVQMRLIQLISALSDGLT